MIIVRYIIISVVFLLPYAAPGQTGNVCKYPNRIYKAGKIDYPGDRNIDVKYYALNLAIDTDQKYIEGNVTINYKILNPAISEIYFDLDDNLTVDSVVSNVPQNSFSHSFNKINIELQSNNDTSSIYSTKIFYRGKPRRSGFGGFVFDNYEGKPWVWTLSEPYAAPTWFPCKDDPSDKADSVSIEITVPKNLIAVSNGVLIRNEITGLGLRKFTWKSNYPIANYLIAVTVGEFNEYGKYYNYSPGDSMFVVNYTWQKTPELMNTYLDLTLDALNYFGKLYGTYPFIKEKYGHVEFGFSGGMEHQTITSLGTWNEGIVVHELAHQWFGDKITCANWHEIWLNEGFAQFSESLYKEHTGGFEAYLNRINIDMNNALRAEGTVYAEDISDVRSIFDIYRTYAKGAAVLHMLRGVVGDSVFFAIIKAYATESSLAYSAATTDDFKQIAESIYGDDLSWFFNEWIYGEGFPDYDYSYSFKNTESGSQANVSVFQNTIRTGGELFVMPVQLKFTDGVEDTIVTAWINEERNDFNFELTFRANSMIFDPYNYVLKRSGEIPPEVNSGDEFVLEQNFPNPFSGVTKIKYFISREANVKLELFNSLGQSVYLLTDEGKRPGIYSFDFKMPNSLSSGVYFLKLSVGYKNVVIKMVLLK